MCLVYSPRRVLGLGREQNADVTQHAMADDSLVVLLRTHTGMSDVDDLLAVCAGLADEDCATYLQAFISDADTADAVAAQIVAARSGGEQTTGATTTEATSPSPSLVTGKKGEVEEFYAGKPGKPGKAKAKGTAAAAAASVVGGASAVAARKKTKKVSADIDGLDRALLAGRIPCNCNARKHELLYNCLSCGKVICAQEGPELTLTLTLTLP